MLDDDFFYYVIGRDSFSNWLALGFDEEPWESPEERLQHLLLRLNESERLAWMNLNQPERHCPKIEMEYRRQLRFSDEPDHDSETSQALISQADDAIEQARLLVSIAYTQMMAEFTKSIGTNGNPYNPIRTTCK